MHICHLVTVTFSLGCSDAAIPMEPDGSSMGRYEAQEHGNMGGEEPDEPMLSGDMSHFYGHYPSSANEAVSKWQLKGKRNIRNLTKRSADATDWKGYVYGAYPEEKVSALSGRSSFGNLMVFSRILFFMIPLFFF